MATATKKPSARKAKPPISARSTQAPQSKQPLVDLAVMFGEKEAPAEKKAGKRQPKAKISDPNANLPAVAVQEYAVPAPLSMREASQIGVDIMEANSSIARQITASAKSADLDELGRGLTGLLVASKEYDPNKLNRWSVARFFRKKAAVTQARVQSVDQVVAAVLNECDRQVRLMDQRIGNLEALYEENIDLYNKMGDAIVAAEARIAESEANPPELIEGDPQSVQERARWNSALLFARKRVDDLKRSRALSMLQGPQVQAMAENCYNVVQDFATLKGTTIPALQRQYAAYVVQMETKKAVQFSQTVREETNRAMIQNAKSLHQNTVASNEAMAQSLVSIETLQIVHQELLAGIADVARIRTEMVGRLRTDAPRIAAMNAEISKSLLLTHQG